MSARMKHAPVKWGAEEIRLLQAGLDLWDVKRPYADMPAAVIAELEPYVPRVRRKLALMAFRLSQSKERP